MSKISWFFLLLIASQTGNADVLPEISLPTQWHDIIRPVQVDFSEWHACKWDQDGVECAEFLDKPDVCTVHSNVPKDFEDRPIQSMFVGLFETCAADESEIRCWGLGIDPEVPSDWFKVPFNNAVQLSIDSEVVCAMDTDGYLKCWDYESMQPVFDHSNLRSFAIMSEKLCIVDKDSQLKCITMEDDWNEVSTPVGIYTENIEYLVAGDSILAGFCVKQFDNDFFQCWDPLTLKNISVGPFRNIQHLHGGGVSACAIDDNHLRCWTYDTGEFEHGIGDNFSEVQSISAGWGGVCAIFENEVVRCWGEGIKNNCW